MRDADVVYTIGLGPKAMFDDIADMRYTVRMGGRAVSQVLEEFDRTVIVHDAEDSALVFGTFRDAYETALLAYYHIGKDVEVVAYACEP